MDLGGFSWSREERRVSTGDALLQERTVHFDEWFLAVRSVDRVNLDHAQTVNSAVSVGLDLS